ncbi:MAG: glycoside hydrolase family 2 TIM barrel-domain containing protein [Verrucomicrobiota bacterium]
MNAVVDIKTGIRNDGDKDVELKLVTRVIDDRGVVVLKLVDERKVEAGRPARFHQIGAIEDELRLWSPADPYLYRVNTMLVVDGKPVDSIENPLGIRKFEHDATRGFLLNNEPIELVGFNRHQHYGYIGDALPDSLHYKDMLQFKQQGFNVMRTAHYPQDDAIIEACDQLGILVYEEAPSWIAMPQNPKWWEHFDASLRTMIRNHRNHPSVVIWGAGINHRGYVPSAVLACKQEDPTRLTASQSSRWTGWQSSGLSDLFANMMYGPGMWDRSEPLLAMEGRRGPKSLGSYLSDELKTGLISWTAHAYYTFHPHRTDDESDRTRLGVMSVFREPYRELPWYPIELLPEPRIHLADPWTEGIELFEVYSNAEEVELLLNDQPFMKAKPSTDEAYKGLSHPPFRFEITDFKPGTITANALVEGKVVASAETRTPEEAAAVRLVADTNGREFHADGSDIVVLYAKVVDKHGTPLPTKGVPVSFKVEGPGSIVGDGADIGANPCKTRRSTAAALLRAGTRPGTITVTASAEGLKEDSVVLTSSASSPDITRRDAKPIHDFESLRVDLGAENQLVQFDWHPWNGIDQKESSIELPLLGGIQASLKNPTKDGLIRWLGEMNVIGKYGFAYGEGALGLDPKGLALEFEGLPAGHYQLRSWHHAPRSNTDSMDPNRKTMAKLHAHKLPYARKLKITVNDSEFASKVSEGKEAQTKPVATSLVTFDSNGKDPVRVVFKDAEGARGVWLNAFELSEWHPSLNN